MISDGLVRRVLGTEERARRFGGELRYAVTICAVLVMLFWLGYQAQLARFMYSSLAMNDFGKFYYSTQLFLVGEDMYGPSPATMIPVNAEESQHFWNLNPPHFHVLMIPFALLPPLAALLAWWGLSLAALVASLRAIARELDLQWTPGRVFWTVFWLVIFSPTSITILTGQLSLLLMWPVTLAWIAARRGQWVRAAVLLGLLASIKPFLGIFLPWLAWRDRKLGAVMAAAGVSGVAVGLVMFGADSYKSWFGVLSAMDWAWVPLNGSIPGVLSRSMAASPRFVPVIDAPVASWAFALGLSTALGLFSLLTFSRGQSSAAVDRGFGGLLLSALVVSPLGWVYYLFLAIGPLVALWRDLPARVGGGRDTLVAMAVPGLIWPVALTGLWRLSSWGPVTLGSLYAWTTLALWGAVVLDSRWQRDEPPD